MSEAAEKNGVATPFLDNSDDFIESHLDSHLPHSEEVDEEKLETEDEELKAREDTSLDFDNDTLTNVEEYSLSGEHDTDKDGIPNIYDSDDDDDGLSTSLEERYDLDPYDPSDAESDLDNDGLSNIFEHERNLSLNREDTDSDGIIDGAEYDYWHIERSKSTGKALSYCLNPDVDDDAISDGMEINGYEAKVITGWTDDGEPIDELRTIDNRDPLVAYRTESGDWSDTDSDGIPDVVESWFSNSSIVDDPTYQEQFKENASSTLYDKYEWVIDYFETVAEKSDNESKAEQWLTDQFNTMVRENMPPMVTKFKADTTTDLKWTKTGPKLDVEIDTHVIIKEGEV
ncbi:MAG: hypothetical protein ACQESD_03615 [Thermoplasmatota archaeon]